MKKIISIPVYILLVVCSLFVVSCSEDEIVNPPLVEESYDFDSARYNWTIDTIYGYYSPVSLSCVDTNDVYIVDVYSSLIHYDGETLTSQILPYSTLGSTIKAYPDKAFIGGSYLTSFNYDRPALLVKEGDIFQQIQIPDSNQKYSILSIERTIDNVLWLGSNVGKLIRYESGEFQYFQFDSIYYVRVFKDRSNNIFLINSREMYDSIGNNGKRFDEIYKYENNRFVNVYSKLNVNIDHYSLSLSSFEGEIYAKNSYSIFKFNGNDFTKIVDFPGIGVYEGYSGDSENDILIQGVFPPGSPDHLFNWNGSKWSKEFRKQLSGIFGRSEKVKGKYIFVGPNDPIETYLIIGSPINK